MIYARTTRDFGTNADIVILSDRPHAHMVAVSPGVACILRKLIREGAKGVELAALDRLDRRALSDLERKLGIRLSHSRKAGRAALINIVCVVDQRTTAEAA